MHGRKYDKNTENILFKEEYGFLESFIYAEKYFIVKKLASFSSLWKHKIDDNLNKFSAWEAPTVYQESIICFNFQ